jgi:hypothetical protein
VHMHDGSHRGRARFGAVEVGVDPQGMRHWQGIPPQHPDGTPLRASIVGPGDAP